MQQREWLVEAMMNMNKHIVTTTNEEIMDMPSQPTLLVNEVFHYFVDVGGLEEGDVGIENLDATYNADVTQFPVDTHTQRNGTMLKSFLRFPMERLLGKEMRGS